MFWFHGEKQTSKLRAVVFFSQNYHAYHLNLEVYWIGCLVHVLFGRLYENKW